MINRAFILTLLCAVAAVSCDKVNPQSITEAPPGGARIKFVNFSVNGPSVNFYSDATKMTAITSGTGVESTNGTAYGSFGNGAYYEDIAPGQHTVAAKITAATDNGLAVTSVSVTIETAKYYTFYLSGFYDATGKKSDYFVVEDVFPSAIDFTQSYVRFVNASSNSSPMTLYAKNQTTSTETAIGATVAYKGGGAFTAIAGGTYDLNTRLSGSSTNVVTRTSVSFGAGRVYTVTLRGDMTVVSTTATNRPFLDNTANR